MPQMAAGNTTACSTPTLRKVGRVGFDSVMYTLGVLLVVSIFWPLISFVVSVIIAIVGLPILAIKDLFGL